MPCDRIRAKLTPYLDGDLDADDGTLVRGHLRTCDACRRIAEDEAVLRDGLRALPSVDPPPSLWAGVQARLAQEEVAEAARPSWRRWLGKLARLVPAPTKLALGVGLATVVALVLIKTQRTEEQFAVVPMPTPVIKPVHDPVPTLQPTAEADDVTADLAAEPARITAEYMQAIDTLVGDSRDVRGSWTNDRRAAFDGKVQSMRDAITRAPEGMPRHRAARALIRYLEGAVIREDVLLASRGD
jgi:anti-sigma factor RsiW